MKRGVIFGGLIVGLLAGGMPVMADELPEMVVTATRSELEVQDAPATVDVVTGEQLRETSAQTVDEAFRRLPGMFSERMNGVAGISDSHAYLQVRGFNRQSQTQVLIDGHPLMNYDGYIQWWNIPVESVDHVEVVRGPMSSLYGGGAMGGVINIITNKDYHLADVSYGQGSFNTKTASVGNGGSYGDFSYRVNYQQARADSKQSHNFRSRDLDRSWNKSLGDNRVVTGFEVVPTAEGGVAYVDGEELKEMRTQSVSAGLTWDITEASYLDVSYGYSEFVLDPQPSDYVGGEFIEYVDNGTSYDRTVQSFAANTAIGSERQQATRNCQLTYFNGEMDKADFSVTMGYTDNYKDDYLWMPGSDWSVCPNSHANISAQSTLYLPYDNTLVIGVDGSHAEVESDEGVKHAEGKMRSAGIFIQDQWAALDTLSIYAGARYDYWKFFDAENSGVPSSLPAPGKDRDKSAVSPKLSIVWTPDEATALRASAGKSFRAPVLWEAVCYRQGNRGTSMPNTDLDPETVTSYEVGVERTFAERVSCGATWFRNDIEDMMYRVHPGDVDGDTKTDYWNENIGEGRTEGYELTVDYRASDAVSFFANYTKTETEILKVDNAKVTEDLEGKQFTNVPEDTYNFGVSVHEGGFFTDVVCRHVGDRFADEENKDVIDDAMDGYDPYTVVDVNLGYRLEDLAIPATDWSVRNLELKLSVYNVSDVQYWESFDRNPGRTWLATVSAGF